MSEVVEELDKLMKALDEREYLMICERCMLAFSGKKGDQCPMCSSKLESYFHFKPSVHPALAFTFAVNDPVWERYTVLQKKLYGYEEVSFRDGTVKFVVGSGKIIVSLPMVRSTQERYIEIDITPELKEIEKITEEIRERIAEKIDMALKERLKRMIFNTVLIWFQETLKEEEDDDE